MTRPPAVLTKLSYLIDNPWSNALDRARQAGAVLADILLNRRLGVRPVSLIGYSLGARVIFFALLELAKQNAFGVVQEVYLFGATVTASIKVWRQVRGVVAGRFVNGFAMNDWILGYLFRATTGGLQTVAGLRPIEHVPDLENVNVTHILEGHMSYRTKMPKLLAHVGFKTTADHFDEPDFDPDAPDREVLTEEELERRRLEKEKRERSALNIFRRKKNKNKTNEPATSQSLSRTASASGEEYDSTPRLSTSSNRSLHSRTPSGSSNLGGGSRNASSLSVSSAVAASDEAATAPVVAEASSAAAAAAESHGTSSSSPASAAPPAPRVAPVPSGFNIDKLREEVAQLPRPSPPERAATVPPPDASAAEPASTPTSLTDRRRLAEEEEDERTPERPPSAPATPLGPPQTDLRQLDQSLDPRELLRRQWLGAGNLEEEPPSSSRRLPLPPPPPAAVSAWGDDDADANLPDDDQYATGDFTFPSSSSFSAFPATTTSDLPTFTFGGGGDERDDFAVSSSANGSEAAPSGSSAAAVWGRKTSSLQASDDNPW